MASQRGITLEREENEKVFVANRGDAFRLRITAKNEVLMPRHIFGHQRTLVNPYDGTQADEFCFIASPFDAVIYPIGEPNLTQSPQYFRKDSIDILLPSTAAVDDVWSAIQEQVNGLIEAYNRLDTLELSETVRLGAAVATSTAESASESTSASASASA